MAGITDPFRLNSSQYAYATEQLYKQRPLLGAYWNYEEPMMDFATNGYAVSAAMPRVVKLMSEGASRYPAPFHRKAAPPRRLPTCWLRMHRTRFALINGWNMPLIPKFRAIQPPTLGANPFVAAACEGASAALSAEDCERNGFDRFSEFSNLQIPTTDCGNGENNCIPVE